MDSDIVMDSDMVKDAVVSRDEATGSSIILVLRRELEKAPIIISTEKTTRASFFLLG